MKCTYPITLLVLLAVGSGCVQPGRTVLAQSATLADSIRFTNLRVAGSIVTLEISREDSRLPTTRATDVGPSDFPEFATFTKDSSGNLTANDAQTHLLLPVTNVKCSDSACTSMTFTITRPGKTLADTVNLKATRLAKVACGVTIRETNGVPTTFNPEFATATVTTAMITASEEGTQKSFYGRVSYVDSAGTGYRKDLTLRNFLGLPSELWIDEINSAVQSDGRVVRISTSVRTFDSEMFTKGANDLGFFASDREGRHVQIGCTF